MIFIFLMFIIIIILLTYLLLKKKEMFQILNSEVNNGNNYNNGNNNNNIVSTTMAIDDNTDSQCSSVCLRFPSDNNIGDCCDCLQEHDDQKFCSNHGKKYIAHHLTENGIFCCPSRQ